MSPCQHPLCTGQSVLKQGATPRVHHTQSYYVPPEQTEAVSREKRPTLSRSSEDRENGGRGFAERVERPTFCRSLPLYFLLPLTEGGTKGKGGGKAIPWKDQLKPWPTLTKRRGATLTQICGMVVCLRFLFLFPRRGGRTKPKPGKKKRRSRLWETGQWDARGDFFSSC